MLFGVGIDIIKVERIKQAIIRYGDKFLNRIFTKREQAYCSAKVNPYESYAARFAVKEAAFKALGKGWDECGGYICVEVLSEELGKPEVLFHGKAFRVMKNAQVTSAYVSISHDAGMSAAVVVLEK